MIEIIAGHKVLLLFSLHSNLLLKMVISELFNPERSDEEYSYTKPFAIAQAPLRGYDDISLSVNPRSG